MADEARCSSSSTALEAEAETETAKRIAAREDLTRAWRLLFLEVYFLAVDEIVQVVDCGMGNAIDCSRRAADRTGEGGCEEGRGRNAGSSREAGWAHSFMAGGWAGNRMAHASSRRLGARPRLSSQSTHSPSVQAAPRPPTCDVFPHLRYFPLRLFDLPRLHLSVAARPTGGPVVG